MATHSRTVAWRATVRGVQRGDKHFHFKMWELRHRGFFLFIKTSTYLLKRELRIVKGEGRSWGKRG